MLMVVEVRGWPLDVVSNMTIPQAMLILKKHEWDKRFEGGVKVGSLAEAQAILRQRSNA